MVAHRDSDMAHGCPCTICSRYGSHALAAGARVGPALTLVTFGALTLAGPSASIPAAPSVIAPADPESVDTPSRLAGFGVDTPPESVDTPS